MAQDDLELDKLILDLLADRAKHGCAEMLSDDLRWAICARVGAMETPKLARLDERLVALEADGKVLRARAGRKVFWRAKA